MESNSTKDKMEKCFANTGRDCLASIKKDCCDCKFYKTIDKLDKTNKELLNLS